MRNLVYQTRLVFLLALTVSVPAMGSVKGARSLESRAFAAVENGDFCDAANLFEEAHYQAPHLDLLMNASAAAAKAKDHLRALRLARQVVDAGGMAGTIGLTRLEEQAAAHPGQLCTGAPLPTGDNAALVHIIRNLEQRLQRLEHKPARGGSDQVAAYQIDIRNSAYRGASNGDIDVVVFTDYQCPFCARIEPMLEKLTTDSRTRSRVRVIYKHFPLSFHKDAKPAAVAALAAREQGMHYFWKFSEKLFEKQRELNSERYSMIANEVGLDVTRFEKDLRNNKAEFEAEIARDMKQGQTDAHVRGTPSIFVNGWILKTRTLEGIVDLANKHSGDQHAPDSAFKRVRTRG